MKRINLLLVVLMTSVLTACSNSSSIQQPREYDLVTPGVLTIGADATYPPHTFLDPETLEFVGLDVDVANEIGNRLGLEVRFVAIQWSGIITALQGKRIDLITSEIHVTPERQEVVNFSDIVFNSGHVIVVTSDNEDIKTPIDLVDKTVLVPIGTTEEEQARRYANNVVTFPLLSECFNALLQGRGDAIVVELFVASEYVKLSNGNLKVVGMPFTETNSAFAFRQDEASDVLRADFNRVLREMKADGTFEEIYSRWIVSVSE